ncbi:uncharacterized protein LOC120572755 [Perca fluviatilis]|uniref:uncharacterized protein LOC120572755 n=1 Tax=Perca fluviatilis TaxID=8168 RepID=UPI001965D1D0|nr:uncharacterized protein LOC120572755 [Perca fluviatilis]
MERDEASTHEPKVGKSGHKCPICGLEYNDLMQHLKLGEQVCNKTELNLLCKLSHRHFSANLDCPVRLCDSRKINRLDKHLQRVHKLGNNMVTLYIQKAKDRHIARQLALLRASKPYPPMVSHLDEIDEAAIEEGIRRKFEDPSSVPHDSEVVALSAAKPFETPSASATPLNKPASRSPRKTLFRRNKPVVRTPPPRCKNCVILAVELQVVKELLEAEIERSDELKQLHSSTNREKAVKHKRHKPFSPSKAPQYVKLVEEFREHTEGSNPTRKIRENARQRANHVLYFLTFMSKPAVPHVNLLFLKDYGRIRRFAAHLADNNFKPTTIKSYLTDAVAFLKYVTSMAPEGVKIGVKSLNALAVELQARIRDVARAVLGQQLAQRRKKSVELVEATDHAWFVKNAPAKISAALDSLEKHPTDKKRQRMFFGLLSGYIVAVTGHRKGAVVNMTRKEVKAADKLKNGDRIIRVEQHKTARYFGQAAIPLTKKEYSWFLRYNCLRSRIEGGLEAETFFHTSSGSECLKLPEYFKEAWEWLELGKAPSFNLLRSSVATYSKRQLGSKAYRRVAAFMCHDEHTAKKFYHAEDPAAEVFKSRNLSVMAISTYAVKNNKKADTQDRRATEDTEEDEVEDRDSVEDQEEQDMGEEEEEEEEERDSEDEGEYQEMEEEERDPEEDGANEHPDKEPKITRPSCPIRKRPSKSEAEQKRDSSKPPLPKRPKRDGKCLFKNR